MKEYGLPDVDILLFQNIDGKELCKMTKDDFQRLTPSYNADILLSHLHYLRESKLVFYYYGSVYDQSVVYISLGCSGVDTLSWVFKCLLQILLFLRT